MPKTNFFIKRTFFAPQAVVEAESPIIIPETVVDRRYYNTVFGLITLFGLSVIAVYVGQLVNLENQFLQTIGFVAWLSGLVLGFLAVARYLVISSMNRSKPFLKRGLGLLVLFIPLALISLIASIQLM